MNEQERMEKANRMGRKPHEYAPMREKIDHDAYVKGWQDSKEDSAQEIAELKAKALEFAKELEKQPACIIGLRVRVKAIKYVKEAGK